MSVGPLLQSVEELDSLSAIKRAPGATQEHDARLLELRTDTGLLYVNPSGWQRIRLRWAFRHFHVLPSQLLSRQDQRLIERLLRSARVAPSLPVPRSTVFGVVENVVFPEGTEMSPAQADYSAEGKWVPPAVSLPQWWPAGVSAVSVCLLLALVSAYAHRFFTGTERVEKSVAISEPAGPPPVQAAVRAVVRIPAPIFPDLDLPARDARVVEESTLPVKLPALAVMKPESEPAAVATESVPTELSAPSANVQRIYVTQLPQEHLVRPVLSDAKLAGELQLRALIGADGSVKEVALVSGDPKLAVPAMEAVRRWRYAQNQLPGPDAEGETLIRMNFFGQDAVSISTVAK
jgi:Gram-negative bacterial TonB protein C-terminal